MKKRFVTVLPVVVLCVLALSGCGLGSTESSPNQVAQKYANAVYTGKLSTIKSTGGKIPAEKDQLLYADLLATRTDKPTAPKMTKIKTAKDGASSVATFTYSLDGKKHIAKVALIHSDKRGWRVSDTPKTSYGLFDTSIPNALDGVAYDAVAKVGGKTYKLDRLFELGLPIGNYSWTLTSPGGYFEDVKINSGSTQTHIKSNPGPGFIKGIQTIWQKISTSCSNGDGGECPDPPSDLDQGISGYFGNVPGLRGGTAAVESKQIAVDNSNPNATVDVQVTGFQQNASYANGADMSLPVSRWIPAAEPFEFDVSFEEGKLTYKAMMHEYTE